MIKTRILEQIGLTRNEAVIYQSILEMKKASIEQIIRRSGLHRRYINKSIDLLKEKKLIEHIKIEGKTYYRSTNPLGLKELLQERKNSLKKEMPALKEMYRYSSKERSVTYLKGKEGFQTLLNDQIITGQTIHTIAARDISNKLRTFYKKHDKNRIKNNILTRLLLSEKSRKHNIPLSRLKFLPDEYLSTTATSIYGDKIAIVHYADEPYVIIIKSKEINESYKQYFEMLWNMAKSRRT